MDKELGAQVDALCSKLIESYKTILKRSRIEDESVQQYELLQLSTASENIVSIFCSVKADSINNSSYFFSFSLGSEL